MLLMLLATLRLHPAAAKFTEGTLITRESWAFLARFCFLSEQGHFEYMIEYDKEYAVQNLLLYYDTDDQWPSAYKPGLTCEQKESFLNISRSQVVNLTDALPARDDSGCEQRDLSRNRHVFRCHRAKRFRTARERWWFIAVSNCNATKGLNLKYKFLMTNGPPGDFWHEHFSADEFYILPILMTFCVVYLFLILAAVVCSVELKHRQLFHATYKLFVISVVLQELGILFQSFCYVKYALDGIGYPRSRTLGCILESSSEVFFLLLLLLLAKGYTVTRGRLRLASSIKLTIFMSLYCVTYTTLFIYEQLFFDPGKVLYLYESPAGYGLIILRATAWSIFVYSIVFTLKHYPEKATFYYPFNMLGTLWFVAGPAFILAANIFIDKWVRESVVCGVLHFIALCGHLLFLFITLPSRANKVFPYHVRTTQIDIMQVAGPDTSLPFAHHPYAPSPPPPPSGHRTSSHPVMGEWVTDVPLELFTVSRAMAMNPIATSEGMPAKVHLFGEHTIIRQQTGTAISEQREVLPVLNVFHAQAIEHGSAAPPESFGSDQEETIPPPDVFIAKSQKAATT